ncbi:unnamed protein product [Protopolystoma xenopodis]|uniref:Uncharacterized protein n=1 Tax=Protopolystoma xenopodis TaxID=117903 RepID=A0A448XSG4_9PLAT|nr:unnamed protein product [Protopolystoma xenopodis]
MIRERDNFTRRPSDEVQIAQEEAEGCLSDGRVSPDYTLAGLFQPAGTTALLANAEFVRRKNHHRGQRVYLHNRAVLRPS